MKGKKKKRHQCNAMYCYNGIFLDILSFFLHLSVQEKIVLLQKQQEPKQVYSSCQQYVIDFLSSLWLIVFTCLRDVVSRFIFAVLKYTLQYSVKKVYFSAQVKPS